MKQIVELCLVACLLLTTVVAETPSSPEGPKEDVSGLTETAGEAEVAGSVQQHRGAPNREAAAAGHHKSHKAGSQQHQKQQKQHHRQKQHPINDNDKRAALADFKRAALADFKRAALADFKRAALADFKRAALADFKRAALADFKRAALADFKRAALADFKRSQRQHSSERDMENGHRQLHANKAGRSDAEKRAYYWDVCSRWVNGHEKLYLCKKKVR